LEHLPASGSAPQIKLLLKPRTEPVTDQPKQPKRAGIYLDWLELKYAREMILDSSTLVFQGSTAEETLLPAGSQGDGFYGYEIRLCASHSVVPFVFYLGADGQASRIEPYLEDGMLCTPVRSSSYSDGTHTYKICLAAPEAFLPPQKMRLHQPAKLRSPNNKADSIIITHEKFLGSVKRLADEQASKGRSVFVANVEDIYDEFIDGATNPYAIRRFLTFALRHWQKPAPETVLFFGDASWDYWGRFPNPVPNYVPGYRVDPSYASDQWYVCVSGEDDMEDYYYGRIPVQEVGQAENAIEKIIGYSQGKERGEWEAKTLFFSDNEFEAGLEKAIEGQVPPYLSKEHIRLRDFEFVDNFYMAEVITIQEKAKTSLKGTEYLVKKITEGCLIFEFFGHGSPNVFCHERVFFGGGSKFSDVKKLKNGGRLPLMLLMTCDTGHFDYAEPKWN
ncbi:MAG TPA: C25 family cysteine peptidase, partial [bacterium]|nr:C25 family cysteine peptidase [bacterium]